MTHQVKGEYCTPLFLIRDCRQKLATYYYYYYFITSHVSTHHSVLPLEAVATLIMRVCEATCPPIYAPSRLQLFAHGSVCIYVDGHRRPAPSPPPPPARAARSPSMSQGGGLRQAPLPAPCPQGPRLRHPQSPSGSPRCCQSLAGQLQEKAQLVRHTYLPTYCNMTLII